MKSTQTPPLDLATSAKVSKIIAENIRSGDVLGLTGELGAGKTTLVSNLAKNLGLKDGYTVSSPTYVIHHVYEAKFPIHHIDLYRLEDSSQIENLGFEEFLGENGITIVEWFEKCPTLWTGPYLQIEITIPDELHRQYKFTIHSDSSNHWRNLLKEINLLISS